MRGGTLVWTLAALLVLPAAAASDVKADGMMVTQPSQAASDSGLFHIADAPGQWLRGTLGAVYGDYFEWGSIHSAGGGAGDPRYCDEEFFLGDKESCALQAAIASPGAPLKNVQLSALLPKNYSIQAFPWDGDLGIFAAPGQLKVDNMPQAVMAGGPWGRGVAPAGAIQDDVPPNTPEFTNRVLDDWSLIASTTDVRRVALSGDFVLEIRGITAQLQTGRAVANYDTTDRSQAGAAPGVEERKSGFLRLYITDGRVDLLGLQGGASWAVPRAMLDVAPGSVVPVGCFQSCASMDGMSALDVAAGPDGLVAADRNAASVVTPDAPWSGIAPMLKAMLWPALVLMAVIAAAGIVWRMTRAPDMASIEAALQAGEYGRAARWSTRLLRRQPYQESAHLSRAIAWSRAGHPRRVVRSLAPFLQRNEPSDGTFHYVLGLAYKDLGEQDQARLLMAEAVHRTPSLLAEIGPDLRPSASQGDTQAYT